MVIGLGGGLVWATLAAETAAGAALLSGRVRAGRRLLAAGVVAATGAVAVLGWALVTDDFTLAYVAGQSMRAAAAPYRLAGLWGGMAGSLLLWVALLAGLAVAGTSLAARRLPDRAALAGAVLAGTAAAFAVPLVSVSRPFDALPSPALDGVGLAPVLQNPAMLYHPILLYLGATATVIPFALAVAGLAAGTLDRAWLAVTRAATLATWGLLAAGLAAGAHWAYVELGWGGFWAWDPVENAGLLPWLAATAFLHRAVLDRRLGKVRPGTAALAGVPFVVAALGALLTRSGAAASVHAFAEARAVGRILLGAWLLAAGVGAGAVATHRRRVGSHPRPPVDGTGDAGRLVALGAALLLAIAGTVAIGTMAPVAQRLAGGDVGVVAPWFYALLCGPPAAAVLVLLVVVEAAGRRRPGRRWRLTRGTLAHAGILLVAAGVVGGLAGSGATVALHTGDQRAAAGTRLRLARIAADENERRAALTATIAVGGRTVTVALHRHRGTTAPTSEAALLSTPAADVLLVPRRIDRAAGTVVLDVHRRPLMLWTWVGAVLLAAAALPVPRRVSRRRPRPTAASAGAGGPRSPAAGVPVPVPAPREPARPVAAAPPAAGGAERR